jgi:hypothetical protein
VHDHEPTREAGQLFIPARVGETLDVVQICGTMSGGEALGLGLERVHRYWYAVGD